MTPQEQRSWDRLYNRFRPIAYRTKKVIMRAFWSDGRWHVEGEGSKCKLVRLIDVESGDWPFDREQVEIHVDLLGRLKGCTRSKVIVIEQGRSHADLERMLRVDR
ncbi:MAG: hypothetical protein HKN44_13350 [Ilumatobacter sp.]|nr:hypothetical protein [Ilumatobacter sp.]